MSSTELSGELSTAPRPVDITKLESALAKLWDDTAQVDPGRDLSRALTMNYIGVSPARDAEDAFDSLGRLLLRHPCRAFMVLLESGDAKPSASIMARTQPDGLGRRMVLEQITLRSSGSHMSKLPGLLRPLLINDLPTHLFWNADLPASPTELMRLARLADQTVIDSARFTDPLQSLVRWQELAVSGCADLAWFRLRPWRRALATAFEHLDWRAGDPVKAIIRHGIHPGALASARLLATYLQQRLGAMVTMANDEQADNNQLTPSALELQLRDSHVVASKDPSTGKLRVQVTLAQLCLLPFQLPASRGSRGDLMAAAVDAAC